jgi:hypothetical protein
VGTRLLSAIGFFLIGGITVTVLLLGLHDHGYVIVFPTEDQHIELLSLFLGAATLVIAAVTLVLALGAVVGYGYIKDAATASGKEAGATAAGEHLAPFVRRLESVLKSMEEAGVADRTEELKAALSGKEGGQ